jgi:uncharacterized protein YneF (UPF0154 family)
LEAPLVIFFVVVAVILFMVGGVFVHRHEAQLSAEAERAMPGPLELP